MSIETGEESLDKYRLIADLGHGGMADVYLALVCGLAGFNKLLVLKQLRPNLAEDPEFLGMFLDEARLAARLNHPNVVQTYEVGQREDHYFIAMEFLEGQPLQRIIHRCYSQGALPLSLHLQILVHVLNGLHHAHELADYDGRSLCVVHRDVTPHNVFVTYDGQVKVMDFGIAKALDSSAETRAGVLKGKVAYMAPEQANTENVDRRTDLFAVGIMLWEAVAHRKMWDGVAAGAILHKLVRGEIPKLEEACPNSPKELREICRRALDPNPENRFSSALEFQAALESFLEDTHQRVQRRDLGDFVSRLFSSDHQRMHAVIDEQIRLLRNDANLESLPKTTPPESLDRSLFAAHSSIPVASVSSLSCDVASASPIPIQNRRPHIFLGAAATLIALSVAIAFSLSKSKIDKSPSALPFPDPASGSIEPPAISLPSRPVDILVTFRASPVEARLFLDGQMLAGNPHSSRVPPDSLSHHLRVEAPGFIAVERELVFDKSLDIEMNMEKMAKPSYKGLPPLASHPNDLPDPPASTSRPTPAKRPKRHIDTDNPWSE